MRIPREDNSRRVTAGHPVTNTNAPHILLAEDDDEMRTLLDLYLRRNGFRVTVCDNGVYLAGNLGSLVLPDETVEFDLIISDIQMPGVNGLDAIEFLHQYTGLPPTILITAFGDPEVHDRARKIGIIDVFDKPFEIDDLIAKVRETLDMSGRCR